MTKKEIPIAEPKGKLGVMTVGLGAVATTMIAGVEAVRRKIALPIGSLTQMGTVRLGKRTEKRIPKIKDFVPLAGLDDLVFASWDLFTDNAYEAALKAGVLEKQQVDQLKDFLVGIRPMPAAFEQRWVKNLHSNNAKTSKTKMDLAEQVMEDIRQFKKREGAERLVMIWCASTEIFSEPRPVHETMDSFEAGLRSNSPDIPPSMIYAYAALKLGVPFINGAPHHSVDIPSLTNFATQNNIPIAGKDFKSGQTFMKTLLAPGLKARLLGLKGWFSTNILGNRDGEVLDDPEAFRSKEESKLSVLEYIIQPDLYPELYKGYYHKVRINYYPPRGDNKESWDNLDIFGWLGYPMQLKVNFLCRDSILAAPMALDLVLFMDLAQR
jgi:myo-inositol-1-phosphate synthase